MADGVEKGEQYNVSLLPLGLSKPKIADAAKQSKKLVELQGEMRQEIETTKAKRDEKFKFAEPADNTIDLPGSLLPRTRQVN